MPNRQQVGMIIAELPFIPAASNWLKLLLSLIAEPLMFVSSLYIVAETVIPGAAHFSGLLTNGTNTVMSLAPEIILPGCFQQAQHAMAHGNKIKAGLLFALCSLFGLLTLLTLASFVWHYTDALGAVLLFIRCASGIAYTIILNISGPAEEMQTPLPVRLHLVDPVDNTVDRAQFDELTETVNLLANRMTEMLQVTQQNNFYEERERPELPEVAMSTPRLHRIAPVRISADAAYLLSASMQTAVPSMQTDVYSTVDDADNNEYKHDEAALQAPRELRPQPRRHVDYPAVHSFSEEKVKRIIDAFLSGTPWREIGNYSRDVKPVRMAWEVLHTDVDTDEHPVYTSSTAL